MEITPDAARDALSDINQVMARTRRAVAGRGADWTLIAWGLVWIACYVTTHVLVVRQRYEWISPVWMAGTLTGIVGMIVIGVVFSRRRDIRSEQARAVGRRIFWSWFTLIVFADVWLVVLWPWHPLQMNAFAVTLIMFGHVMIGVWMGSRFFIILGAAVALAALGGYLLTAHAGFPYYNLWMAAAGGGALLASGIYIRLAWRQA